MERLSAEIQKASAAGERDRARKLAGLQRDVISKITRDILATGARELPAVPLQR